MTPHPLVLALAFAAFLSPASAQETASQDADAIEIESDMLEVDRQAGTALFSGAVRAAREDLRLDAERLKVFYEERDGETEITRLEAEGQVIVTTAAGQSAHAQWAVFEVVENHIRLGDHVSLVQGENIIEGGETRIRLDTGEAQMRAAAGQRVRGLFVPDASAPMELLEPTP